MLTKILTEGNDPSYTIVLGSDHYDDIRTLQNALLWAIKVIADDHENRGMNSHLWEIANLLEAIQPTEQQAYQIDNLLRADN